MSPPSPGARAEGESQSRAWRDTYSATAGLPFDPHELESRLVWIWGSPRSGSTWLLRQLCHPARIDEDLPLGFAAGDGRPEQPRAVPAPEPREPAPADREPSPGDPPEPLGAVPLNEFLISSHAAPRGRTPVEADGTYVAPTPNVFLAGFNSYALASSFADVWGPELRRLTLVRIAAALDRAPREGVPLAENPLVVIKEVNGSHAAGLIMSLFPRSRMLVIVRDGRDVIDSRLHAHQRGGWLVGRDGPRFRTKQERLEWVRGAARDWACNMDSSWAAYGDHDPARRRSLRYEELRGAPESELAGLRSWLGLPADPELIAAIVAANSFERVDPGERGPLKTFRAATPGLWRRNLTRAERRAVDEIIGTRLERAGYER